MIRLQFSRQADIVSDLIAWFTQGEFSHVDAVTPKGTLIGSRSDYIEGKPSGVQERPANYVKWAETRVFEIPASPEQTAEFYDFLYSQIGKPYDHVAIAGFIFGRDWKQQNAYICSELQAVAMTHAKICDFYVAANLISPDSLALAISVLPGIKIV